MATELEWSEAYDKAVKGASEPGRYQYVYAGEQLVLGSYLDCPLEDRPSELPDGDDICYHLDEYIADLDDDAGFSLWYDNGIEALYESDGKLPDIHTWFYWARYHEDTEELNNYFISVCEDRNLPLPQWL